MTEFWRGVEWGILTWFATFIVVASIRNYFLGRDWSHALCA